MNSWWYILIGCSSIAEVLTQVHHGGVNNIEPNPRSSHYGSQSDFSYNDEDCKPWEISTSKGCINCSGRYDTCNYYLKCCNDLICGDDGFCACNNDSNLCGDDSDDSDDGDDSTLLEAAKIALGVAVIIAVIAACTLLWRTCSKYRSRRRRNAANQGWQARRQTRQQSSLTSIERYVLSRLCDRPPCYEDNSYIQEEKPPPYEMVVAAIGTPMSTATLLSNTAPFRCSHVENAAYVDDETENSSRAVPTHQAGLQLCPAYLCHCASAVGYTAAPGTTQFGVGHTCQNPHEGSNACGTAPVNTVMSQSKAETEHCSSKECDQQNCECTTTCYNSEESKHIRTESHN